jgi:hypothetical protein
VTILLAVAAIALGVWWLSRPPVLFAVVVRRGRAHVVRGRVPSGLLGKIEDIVGGPPVGEAVIQAVSDELGTHLEFEGTIDEARRQQLRNVFALHPASKVRRG